MCQPGSWSSGRAPLNRRASTRRSVPIAGLGQGARQRADGILVLAFRDADDIVRQFKEQALLWRHLDRVVSAQSLEEVADLDPERLSHLVQPPRGDATDPLLVLVRLLMGDTDPLAIWCWVSPSMIRRSRMRAPTCRSVSCARARPGPGFLLDSTITVAIAPYPSYRANWAAPATLSTGTACVAWRSTPWSDESEGVKETSRSSRLPRRRGSTEPLPLLRLTTARARN